MTVTNVDKDLDARTLTITAEFDAPLERVWELWADPRKLERWWGRRGRLRPSSATSWSPAAPSPTS